MPSPVVDVKPGVAPAGEAGPTMGGRRTRGATVKQMKRMLKKAGLKTTGKKASLTKRAKKAHLKLRGGEVMEGEEKITEEVGGRRRRKSRGFRLF